MDTAGGEYVSMGGRDAEMTFGIKKLITQEMYIHSMSSDDALNWLIGADDIGDETKL